MNIPLMKISVKQGRNGKNKRALARQLAALSLCWAGACTAPNTANLPNTNIAEPPFERVVVDKDPPVVPLSPAESIKKFQLPPGYRVELVASEPMVQEPVALAWDGNGRMYVAEMNTYMQDATGSGQYAS